MNLLEKFPMWSQFVEKKKSFIGGVLQELQDSWPRVSDEESTKTVITDIRLTPNGEESAFFEVIGKDYSCGGSTSVLGITAGENDWITFSGYGGHKWRITTPNNYINPIDHENMK